MSKYIAPEIEIVQVEVEDVIATSGFTIKALEGVDSKDSKSAVFNAMFWF